MQVDAAIDTRARLLVVAEEAVAELGPAGVTLREVARRAGLSHGAPLRHFASLAALLAAVATDGFRSLQAAVGDGMDAAGAGAGPRERLAGAAAGYVRFARNRPAVFSLMFRPDVLDVSDPEYAAEGIAAFGQLRAVVEECRADGWRADEDGAQLAGALWALVHGIADLSLQGALAVVTENEHLHAQLAVAMRLIDLPPVSPDTDLGGRPFPPS
ncbi:MAG TPA: TetR/AcrR family transcriptional regulator [Acidimicrobiia bacterium]|nr:TetR/AcrR family transcriptional regulator [Acidimicrobiia bacterium]